MDNLFIWCVALIALAYIQFKMRQNRDARIKAMQEELENEFPKHSDKVSIGVAACIVSEIEGRKSTYRVAWKAKRQLEKQADWTKPEADRSQTTKDLDRTFVRLNELFDDFVIGQLPDTLRDYVHSLARPKQIEMIDSVVRRALARSQGMW